MAFPSTLTNAIDDVTEIIAAHLNNLEAKVGVDASAVVSSLDYLLKNPASVDPGHKHGHGGLQGLGDDDHTQYIKHALGTAIGDLLCASSVGVFTALPGVAVNNVLLSGGVGAVPAWGKVGLTTHVSGILGSANGGTGNGFTKFTGPTTAEKTFTLPDASATILTTNAAVTAAQGGTGQSSYAVGDLLYASAANALNKLADVAVGNVLISGGVGVAPSWGKVGLTTHVDGVLPVANGGTGTATGSITGTGALVLAAGGANQNVTLTPSGTGATILNGNVGIGVTDFGASAAKALGMGAGTAPTTAPADMAQMWVQDQAAGNACFHFMTELAKTIKLYQQAHLVDPAADVIALAAWAANINLYLENLGLMASA